MCKKNKKALFLSYIFMGGGHIYLKHYFEGIIFFIIEVLYILNIPNIYHGIWGILTLGDTVQSRQGFDVIQGDNSIYLLVNGVITVLFLIALFFIYRRSIKNVYSIIKNDTPPPKLKEFFRSIYEKHFVLLILIPAGAMFVIFILTPIIITMLIAFTNYSAPNHIPPRNLVDWVGLSNFSGFFSMKILGNTLVKTSVWTVIWAFSSTFTCYAGGFALALILSIKTIKYKKLWRTIMILPWAIPGFVSLLMFRLLFSGVGPLNSLIESILGYRIMFWSSPLIAKITIVLINMWLGVPYFMVMISGSLTNIPSDIYEASCIDGASITKQFRHITLPMVLMQTAPIIVLTIAMNFNNFNAIYLLTSGDPKNSSLFYAGETDLLITWLYKLTLQQNQYNLSALISMILFIFLVIVSYIELSKTKAFKENL